MRALPLGFAMLGLLTLLGTAFAQAPAPPLQISADNMSGSHGPEGDVVNLNGNVRITRARTVLTAARGRYLRAEGMLFLEEKVRLRDSTTTVTCDRASYAEQQDVVELSGNVTLEDKGATLHAPAATYDRRAGRAELYGGVTGTDDDRKITCDRAYYLRDSLLLQARGNVKSTDEKNQLELTARSIDYDRGSHEAVATGDPALSAEDEDGRHAVIHARTLRLNTETRLAEAIDSVHVVRDTLQASGDYGLFDDKEQRGWLLGHPRAWDEETSVTGDTLEMITKERRLERVEVRSNAAVDYLGIKPGSKGEKSRLTGERINVYFNEEDIDSLIATGKAANEYLGVPEPGKTAERNSSQGDTITVFFDKGKIDRARFEGNAKGEYHLAADVGDTTAEQHDVIRYDAKQITYLVSKNRILLEGASHLTYRDLELHAKRVEYNVGRQTLLATGEPELNDRGDKVSGNIMTYDLESRVGNIYKAETTYEKGLYYGSRIRKVNDNELDVLNGAYTTCDLDQPHYHFAARWMKIYLKDKLVAKPVVFYIRKVPILALPFWIFPIKPGRHSGFLLPQLELGFTNRAGQFFRNAGYYWAPNDYMDLTLSGDYYAFEPSWVLKAEGNYKLLYKLDGSFRGSFARNENPQARTENWDLDADHSQDLSPTTRLVARASFVSSKDYNSSALFNRSFYQRVNRFLVSSVALSHSAEWASFNFVVDRRQDLDADDAISDPDGAGPLHGSAVGTVASLPNLTETLPTVSIGFPTRTLGSIGLIKGTALEKALSTLYFDLDTRFVSLHERRAYVAGQRTFVSDSLLDSTGTAIGAIFDSITVLGQRSITRRGAAANTSLSDSRRLFGWLNVQPSLNAEGVIFDFDELGNKVVPTGTWSSGLTTSATFYGTFLPRIGPLEGIRHIVTPVASFSYSPEFKSLIYIDQNGQAQSRFRGFGGIGVSGFKTLAMNFGLNQRLQVKLKKGDKEQKLDNLVSWNTTGGYNFLWKERGLKHPLTPLSSILSIQPPGILNASFTWVTDVYNPRPLQTLTYNTWLNLSSAGARGEQSAPELPIETTQPTAYDEYENMRENWSLNLSYSYSGGYPSPNRWESNQTANAVLRFQLTPTWGLDYSAQYDVTLRQIGLQRFALTKDLHCWQAQFTRTFAPGGEAEYYFRLGVKEQREIFFERGTRGGSIGGIQ